jgi:hypothetical protein
LQDPAGKHWGRILNIKYLSADKWHLANTTIWNNVRSAISNHTLMRCGSLVLIALAELTWLAVWKNALGLRIASLEDRHAGA